MSRDIYIAILWAAHKGVGLRLSADEVGQLSIDEAIHKAALNGLEQMDWPDWKANNEPDWENINPNKKRKPANLAI